MSTMAERLAEATLNAQCSSCGHEAEAHSWYGPCLQHVGEACFCQHSREWVYAQSLLPVVEREIAAVRGEALREAADRVRALPKTRTQAWLKGWDSVSLEDVLAALTPDPDREAKEGGRDE